MKARLDLVRVELSDHTIGARRELRVIFIRPPLHKVTVSVKLRALIVKTMRHLVAYDRAYAAVVEGVVGFRIIKGRLKDASREDYLVHRRVVVSINRRRRHAPFSSINRLAYLAEVSFELKLSGGDGVVVVSPFAYLKSFVAAPLVREANLANESIQLSNRALSRLIRHPTERRQIASQSFDQILDHLLRARFRLRRESLVNVELA